MHKYMKFTLYIKLSEALFTYHFLVRSAFNFKSLILILVSRIFMWYIHLPYRKPLLITVILQMTGKIILCIEMAHSSAFVGNENKKWPQKW